MKRLAEGRWRARFSVTRFGIVFIAVGLALFAEGILHGELAALLSGAGLLAYAAYSLAISAIASFAWRDASVTAEWNGVEHVILHATPELATATIASWLGFCSIRYEAIYRHEGAPIKAKTFTLFVPLSLAGKKSKIVPPARGKYIGAIPTLVIADFTGIFRFSRPLSDAIGDETIIVPARPESCDIPALPSGRSSIFAGKSTFRRSEELYEVRQYLAGDDPRKINWNIFAHTGELAIREGELLPPPSTEFLIYVNPAKPTALRGDANRGAERRFEILVSKAAYVALRLSEKRRIVTLAIGKDDGSFERIRIAPERVMAEREILEAFASCALRARQAHEDLPPESMPESGNAALIAFTMPDQPVPPFPSGIDGLFLLGPSPENPPSWSPARELRKCVFLDPEETRDLTSRAYRIRFMNALSSLRKERDSVQAI